MNQLFEQAITSNSNELANTRTWAPAVDIEETADEVVMHVELPGINPENVSVQINNGVLTIRGERHAQKRENSKQFIRVERTYGSFFRSFTLGVTVEQEKIHANYHDGILDVVLPKAEEAKPKQIEVKVGRALE